MYNLVMATSIDSLGQYNISTHAAVIRPNQHEVLLIENKEGRYVLPVTEITPGTSTRETLDKFLVSNLRLRTSPNVAFIDFDEWTMPVHRFDFFYALQAVGTAEVRSPEYRDNHRWVHQSGITAVPRVDERTIQIIELAFNLIMRNKS